MMSAVPTKPAQRAERAEQRGRQNAAGSKAGALRDSREQGYLDPTSERLQQFLEGGAPAGRVESRQEARHCHGGLGQGKFAAGLAVSIQFFVCPDGLLHTKIDGAYDDFRPGAELGKRLYGRLAIQIDREVHNPAAVFQTVRRGIGPPAGEVQTSRASGPDYLVRKRLTARVTRRKLGLRHDSLT